MYLLHQEARFRARLASSRKKATLRGEWVAVSHDSSYKTMFSLIGQKKMSQQHGGLYTAHTFIGVTGGSPGFSAQRTEGEEGFERALKELFTPAMIAQVRLLYSDSPCEAFLLHLPNALGCAEDSLHLVLRCEYCIGGRRNECTRWILDLQNKSMLPLGNGAMQTVYHGTAGPDISWEASPTARNMAQEEWRVFKTVPFLTHAEYVSHLKLVASLYPQFMGCKQPHGDRHTMLHVLQAGSSFRHFMYLQNNAIFRS